MFSICVLQVAVYNALSFYDITDTDSVLSKNVVKEMKERRFGVNVRDRLKEYPKKGAKSSLSISVKQGDQKDNLTSAALQNETAKSRKHTVYISKGERQSHACSYRVRNLTTARQIQTSQ